MFPSPIVLRTAGLAWLIAILAGTSAAADWPTRGGDNRRSGVTEERLALPLSAAWVYQTDPPRPAWPDPARQDFWHNKGPLVPSITFDRTFRLAVADGAVFFGSSANDKITSLDVADGHVRWSFFTEGPVRLAPSVAKGKVYAGSDDGHVYCLAAGDGTLLWKVRPGPADDRLPGNGRMISKWPVRTGVLVDDGIAYLCAGLFPAYGVYLAALDAADGTPHWKKQLSNISPQGDLLASDTRLFVPSGRNAPAVFDRRDGKPLGNLHDNRRGGSYALLVDEVLVYRGEEEASLGVSDTRNHERLVLFDGLHLVARGKMSYVHSENRLAALDRVEYLRWARQRNQVTARKAGLEKRLEQLRRHPDPDQEKELGEELAQVNRRLDEINRAMDACWVWKRPCGHPHALILAGDVLFAGGENEVVAVRAADGEVVWKGQVTGNARGLAVAGGRLFVSTEMGTIHCFQ